MIGKLSLILLLVGLSNCFLFPDTDNWNDLKVTWGINPFGSNNFVSLPRTEQEAVQNEWKKEKGCADGANGSRYVLRGDRSVLLIFNANGVIAGIGSALPKNLPFNVPSANIQPYFDDEGDSFVISAYFIDPTSVCVKSRFRQVTGDRLVFYSKQKSMSVSLKESSVDKFWTKGKCFWTMGQHYWADVTGPLNSQTKGDNFFPAFLLYNGGNLNGFGWAFNANLTSNRLEHPGTNVLGQFFNDIPKFFYDPSASGVLSTLHIYLDKTPQLNRC